MGALRRNPSCRLRAGETALPSHPEASSQVEGQGFLQGLRAWQESCPCCFSSTHPDGLPVGPPMPLDADDVSYVRREFVPLREACIREGLPLARVREMVGEKRLPLPPYVLPEGTEMVPDEYFDLMHQAGSDKSMQEHFLDRFTSAASEHGDPASLEEATEGWADYLSGEYFVCLKRATPENIVRKGWLVARIEQLLDVPRKGDPAWREELVSMVNELDDLERLFAAYDRDRFGAPSSRDRLITAVRLQYL